MAVAGELNQMIYLDVIEPRHDPEPGYWEDTRLAAGQWATWRWAEVWISA